MKNLDSPEAFNNGATEVTDIFATIEAVKGKDYTSILRVIYMSFNYHKMMTELGNEFIPREAVSVRNVFAVMQIAHEQSLRDMIKTMVSFHVQANWPSSPSKQDERIEKLIIDIGIDLQTLSDKQDEYGMVVIGGKIPK